ncbi:YciI family protein [Plantactinospora sp. KLBMP9567]|uniref:YciI family protein n=1 Tax=Plantactinospora sp. KLBMP9567 TaxID=3085900 RepID=UPI002980D71F|nr:YciI family protein [Plantactinospora sp. KLBMP9567]MDW5324752.1 YciI family protein [Plantactinospora sp. KLBMP9567]
MIVVELRFAGDPAARLAARPAHRELLARLHADGALLAAGPWADDSGALLLFDADESTVRRALDVDPYYRTPGVSVVAVRSWTPVVGGPAAAGGAA